MLSKLPRWVELGAFLLALVAGSVNAIGLLGFEHQAVSHLTGTVTLLGLVLLDADTMATHFLLIVLSFVVGAVISGLLLDNTALSLGRNYALALVLESLLLVAAMVVLGEGSIAGHYLASAACGLQNAMVTTFSGALIRTTHVTGLFTDLGLMIGRGIKGAGFDRRKALLYGWIIAGFTSGASVGAFFFGLFGFAALAVPASICLLIAAIYALYNRCRRWQRGNCGT